MKLYLIGSLRNKRIPLLAEKLRAELSDTVVFDDWYSAGPEADDKWKEYEKERGRSYRDALKGYAARHVFDFDRSHLDSSSHVLLVLPAGRSGHMEIMYAQYGTYANTAILQEDEERWDVMYQFIPTILHDEKEITEWVKSTPMASAPGLPDLNLMQGNQRSSEAPYTISPVHLKKSRKSQSSGLVNISGMDGKAYQMVSADTLKLGHDMY